MNSDDDSRRGSERLWHINVEASVGRLSTERGDLG